MTKSNNAIILAKPPGDMQEFAALGAEKLAYVRSLDAADVRHLFPQVPPLPPGNQLFAVFSGDGTPISLADSHASALASLWNSDFAEVSVH